MHRFGLGLRVVVPVRCLGLGRSLGLEVLDPGVCIPAQEVSKGATVKPLPTVGLHDMDHTYRPAGRPAGKPRMPITLPLEDEASYGQAVANADDMTGRDADQDVYEIFRRQIGNGR